MVRKKNRGNMEMLTPYSNDTYTSTPPKHLIIKMELGNILNVFRFHFGIVFAYIHAVSVMEIYY